MELHLTARQTRLWQRLLALTRDQLMGLSMQIESTGHVDSEMLTTLAQQFGLDEPLPNDRLSQRVFMYVGPGTEFGWTSAAFCK